MGDDVKWFRVTDPLSPLFGCDVDGYLLDKAFGNGRDGFVVTGLRRVDIFMGDRPFQLVAKDDEDLGIMVDAAMLKESAIQDDIVELVTDRPFGIAIDEGEMTRDDGLTLSIARFERAVQIAMQGPDGDLIASKTFVGDPEFVGAEILEMFEDGADQDDIVFALKRRD